MWQRVSISWSSLANICFSEASPQQALMEAETLPATDSQLDHLLGNGTPSDDRTTPAPASPDSTLPSSASQYEDDVTSLELKDPILQILYIYYIWWLLGVPNMQWQSLFSKKDLVACAMICSQGFHLFYTILLFPHYLWPKALKHRVLDMLQKGLITNDVAQILLGAGKTPVAVNGKGKGGISPASPTPSECGVPAKVASTETQEIQGNQNENQKRPHESQNHTAPDDDDDLDSLLQKAKRAKMDTLLYV